MAKEKPTTAPEQEIDLNLKREAFCQYYTKNQALFGNATLSYAEAYGYKLDELSREPQYITIKGKKKKQKVPIEYDKAYQVCATEGARLLKIPELLRDDIVDSRLPRPSLRTTTCNPRSAGSTSTTRSAG